MHARPRRAALAPTALLAAACTFAACEKDDGPPQSLAPLPPGPPVEREDPYFKSPSRFGAVHLHAGFNPDPRVIEGVSLGEVSASTLRKRCRGWVSKKPDYLLVADTAFLQLYLIARARKPVSVVVRKPDGSVDCRNARKGTKHTVLELDLPLGTSQLWIGASSEGGSTPFRLGISEVSWRSKAIPLPER